jgi:hypothetical protein
VRLFPEDQMPHGNGWELVGRPNEPLVPGMMTEEQGKKRLITMLSNAPLLSHGGDLPAEPVKVAKPTKPRVNAKAERHILIAADNVKKLRSSDVYRVLDEGVETKEQRQMVAQYIIDHRPELADEVHESLKDLGTPLQKALPHIFPARR